MNLLYSLGEIYEIYIEEALTANIAADLATRKRRKRRHAAIATAGSIALALAVFAVKNRKQKRLIS